MQAPDRSKQPEVKPAGELSILDAERIELGNGLPVYRISGGNQEIFNLELVFDAGRAHEQQSLAAIYTNKLLEEGTKSHGSEEISRILDYHGAIYNKYCNRDFAGTSIFSLNKHAEKTLSLFTELITEPAFHEEEFNTLNKNERQHFLINSSKVKHLAREYFFPVIYGESHPYGKLTGIEDFDQIELESVRAFYRNYYQSGNCIGLISGKVTDEIIHLVDRFIGKTELNTYSAPASEMKQPANPSEKKIIRKEGALQSAIRIGRPIHNKLDEDYIPLKFVSILLGGYFGSRLMSNIREDKGYTYGIGANVVSLRDAGYFFIATETGTDVREKALHEIYKELKKLREERVSAEELDLVKKYMTGSFMHSIDGPFALAQNYKNVLLFGLDKSYFHKIIDVVNSMTSEKVQEIANKYLREEDLSEIIAGK